MLADPEDMSSLWTISSTLDGPASSMSGFLLPLPSLSFGADADMVMAACEIENSRSNSSSDSDVRYLVAVAARPSCM